MAVYGCLVFFHMVRAGAYWHKIHDIHACAFAVQTKLSRLDFFFDGSWCISIHFASAYVDEI